MKLETRSSPACFARGRRLAPWALLVLVAGAGCHGPRRPPAPAHDVTHDAELVELRIDEMPTERPGASLGAAEPSLERTIAAIDDIARRADRKGLFLRLGPLGRGSARADELVAALQRLRRAHEPVHCHFEMADNASFYVMARGCDRISMTPAGHLMLIGIAAHLYSVRGLLEWAGVKMDMVQAGSAKGAADPFTRDEPTAEHRENVAQLVGELNARLTRAIDARTGRTDAAAVLARGPFTSSQALAAHLIDAVEFDDAARNAAKAAASVRSVDRVALDAHERITFTGLLARLSADESSSAPTVPHLVVAHLSGSIVDASQNTASTVAGDPFVQAMRNFAADDDVRAVVLRIDSPGGSALASDRMWHAVSRLARKKPVIVSIGDMAASGGYYVACAGTEIFASESSIVGSIGVVAGRPDFSVLLSRFGVQMHPIVTAPSADLMMPFRPLRDDERARFQASAEEAYTRFLARISASRTIPAATLASAAEGRIWSGIEARRLGLVDRLGTADEAIARARALGHLAASAPVHTWPPRGSVLELLLGTGSSEAHGPLPIAGLDPALAQLLFEASLALEGAAIPRTAVPYALDIR
jgi:protease-4